MELLLIILAAIAIIEFSVVSWKGNRKKLRKYYAEEINASNDILSNQRE